MEIKKPKDLSPMMKHYLQTKEEYKDCILFYRLGDFYELFFDDAIEMSKVLDLTLTGKECGLEERAPMCGIPFHAAENYINKLISKGYKVALCEQLTGPQKNAMVERKVVRVITPGTIMEESIIDQGTNNFIASIYEIDGNIGITYAELTTGEFVTSQYTGDGSFDKLNDILVRVQPSEIVFYGTENIENELMVCKMSVLSKFTPFEKHNYDYDNADKILSEHFNSDYKEEFNLTNKTFSICSAGALLAYLNQTQKRNLSHINKISWQNNNMYMQIDISSRKNLEIMETMRDKRKKGALITVLDKTITCMGKRLMRKWIEQPLCDLKEINQRLDSVEEITKKLIKRDSLKDVLKQINDIERISGRIAYGSFSPKDADGLKQSLALIPQLKNLLSDCKSLKLNKFYNQIPDFSAIVETIDKAIAKDPPRLLSIPGYIKDGYNQELDELRNLKESAVIWQQKLEERERDLTGIKNLRICYNKVFGYFIEVNKQFSELVPMRYKRKQTVANNERYITEELKELEEKVLSASESALKIEQKIFNGICQELTKNIPQMQLISNIIAEIDCILSFANISMKNNYVKPKVTDKNNIIKIESGRHPVVEDLLKNNEFIPNDTILDGDQNKIMIITGPNMAGKSTYMRQVAIITLMAHIGCFVPAKYAEISLTDKIFTRVGASDDLAIGQSTFMVEMMEVANILENATPNSLVILDEIGRGTSTYDGLSIAWAVVEHISKVMHCKTLFATHYHELTELEGFLDGVKNYNISVKEINDELVFLRKIVRGGANRSFGVEVAKLAGVPKEVIVRAKQISNMLEKSNINKDLVLNVSENRQQDDDKDASYRQIISMLKDIDINKITPLGAFDTLCDIISKIK